MTKIDLKEDWNKIYDHFNQAFRSNFHVSIASVTEDGIPSVTPIGTLFLNRDQTGFYFEKFPKRLRESARGNGNVCVLGVNSSTVLWLKALISMNFERYPALKLYGELGDLRKATEREQKRLHRRMKLTRWTRGHNYLWGDMDTVREITFTSVECINLGKMTR